MSDHHDFRVRRSVVRTDSDADLAWDVIAPLWEAIDFSLGYRAVSQVLSVVSPGQRGLLALDWCQKELRNGGFEQFFLNATGMLAAEALAGFRLIGATGYAELLGRALQAFPDSKAPTSRAARARALAQMADRAQFFKRLDDAFFDLLRGDDLEAYRARYVREHPDQFFLPERESAG